jgi:hypothetical protein
MVFFSEIFEKGAPQYFSVFRPLITLILQI